MIKNLSELERPSRYPSQSRLGLFWFIPYYPGSSRFASFSQPRNQVAQIGDFQKIAESHADAWFQVQNLDSSLRQYEFDYFPRGRVDFFRPGRRWMLSIDQKLQLNAFVAYVAKEWLLQPGHLTVAVDFDYRSTVCVGSPA